MENKILIYPKMKKYNKDIDNEEINVKEIEDMSAFYVGQIIHNLHNHNLSTDRKFLIDMNMVNEYLKSAILRSCGVHHPLQDYVDGILEMQEDEEEDDT